jgi:hypothetical protein
VIGLLGGQKLIMSGIVRFPDSHYAGCRGSKSFAPVGGKLDVMTGADDGADPDARPGWRWDVALSFAGAQRGYVEQVAQALRARGVRCFYDADEQIELWGRYLAEELPAIYGEQAAAVVVFMSAEYAARDWTRHERRAALTRAVRERREYVLPARFDDTPLPGLLSDMVTVDLRYRTPQQFAGMIVGKLAGLGVIAPTSSANARGPAAQVRGEGSNAGGATRTAAEPVGVAPVEAFRLLGDVADLAARSVADEQMRTRALAEVAKALAAWDPDRAERLAWSITHADWQATALAEVG